MSSLFINCVLPCHYGISSLRAAPACLFYSWLNPKSLDKSLIYDSTQYMFVAGIGAHHPQLTFPPARKIELRGISIGRNQYPVGIHRGTTHSIRQLMPRYMCAQATLQVLLGKGGMDGKVWPLLKLLLLFF